MFSLKPITCKLGWDSIIDIHQILFIPWTGNILLHTNEKRDKEEVHICLWVANQHDLVHHFIYPWLSSFVLWE